MVSQFYPRFYTMIPAGLLVGFGGGPLWCAKCTYLTVASEALAKLGGGINADMILTRFYGVFFMFYQFSQVWGNLISSTGKHTNSPLIILMICTCERRLGDKSRLFLSFWEITSDTFLFQFDTLSQLSNVTDELIILEW